MDLDLLTYPDMFDYLTILKDVSAISSTGILSDHGPSAQYHGTEAAIASPTNVSNGSGKGVLF